MLFEYLIIISYFFASAIPVAVVYMFYRIDTDPETAGMIPEADTYRLPDEDVETKYLPPGREDGEHPTAELPQRRRGAEENNGEIRGALPIDER